MKAINFLDNQILQYEKNEEIFEVRNQRGEFVDAKIIELIGMSQIKNNIYIGLLVEVDNTEKQISVEFYDHWSYIYKDEMIELIDLLSWSIGAQIFNFNVSDHINLMIKNEAENRGQTTEEIKQEIATYGIGTGVLSELIYYTDIYFFYNIHKKEIDKLSKEKEIYKKVYEAINKVL